MSLYAHHSHERDVAINRLLDAALRACFNPQELDAKALEYKIAAITHPLLADSKNRLTMLYILQGEQIGYPVIRNKPEDRLFPPWAIEERDMRPDCIVEIQQFLRDPSRSGSCYVDSGMYAPLSLWIAKVLFEPHRSAPVITFLYSILFMTLISKDNKHMGSMTKRVLRLAVDTLPFYISNADYTSDLADYFLSHTLNLETLEDLYPNIQPVQDAIDLYLQVNIASIIICFILTLPVEQRKPLVKNDDLPKLSRRRWWAKNFCF